MPMRRTCGALVVMLAAAAALSAEAVRHGRDQKEPARASLSSFSGRAVTDSGRLWYTEHHSVRTAGGRTEIDTRYVAADGTPIADLSAEITSERYLPKTHLIDHRDNYTYAVEPLPDQHLVRLTQRAGRAAAEQKTIALRADLMTFQGVLLFVIDQRAALQRGETLFAQSIVPSRMTSYGVRIYKHALQGNLLTVRIEMTSAAFRLFSTPTDLTIDVASGRLLAFSGPSNLLDEKDKPVRVHVIYEYQ